MVQISLIVAHDESNGIAKNGEIPWHCSFDLKKFKKVTIGKQDRSIHGQNAVIMGRKTWESLPEKVKPLHNRLNIVLTKNTEYDVLSSIDTSCINTDGRINLPESENSLENAIKLAHFHKVYEIFIIGGASIYKEVLDKKICDRIYVTKIFSSYDCDQFFPEIPKEFVKMSELSDYAKVKLWNSETDSSTTHSGFVNRSLYQIENKEEEQYLNMIKEIFNNGVLKPNRTGVDTLSVFGKTMKFSLRNGQIPLLTTKRVFWKGVAEELLWFISGSTNANELAEKGVHIWDGNASREFLDSRGLYNREDGDLGPVYGFQWRHFGAEYKTMYDDYKGEGYDQLAEIIQTLKTDPYSRRMVLSAWNPIALREMALPPCHVTSFFYVTPKENGPDELSCQMLQRSCDIGLGVPFNIASYSLLTHILAKCTGMVPGEFMHILGDAHIYVNHIDALKEQVKRAPRLFPTLKFNTDNTDIDSFKYKDFEIINYRPHKSVKMDMVV